MVRKTHPQHGVGSERMASTPRRERAPNRNITKGYSQVAAPFPAGVLVNLTGGPYPPIILPFAPLGLGVATPIRRPR